MPAAACVRAGDDVRGLSTAREQMHASQCLTIASAQSEPKMCVTREYATTRLHAAPARQGSAKNVRGVCEWRAAYLKAKETPAAKQRTPTTQRKTGAKYKTIA